MGRWREAIVVKILRNPFAPKTESESCCVQKSHGMQRRVFESLQYVNGFRFIEESGVKSFMFNSFSFYVRSYRL